MVVIVTTNTFWVATPCSQVDCCKHFEGIFCFRRLQGNPRVERVVRAWGGGQGRRAKRTKEWNEGTASEWVEGDMREPVSEKRAERANGWKER